MIVDHSCSTDKLLTMTTVLQLSSRRKYTLPFRRSCSAVTEREMMGAIMCQPARAYRISRSMQLLQLLEKDKEKHTRGIEKNCKSVLSYDVFLGGSCNPTTWRKNLAVPYLQKANVSFYNPQMDLWSQELIEIEHAAKENATILFYVIDIQTRNVVSYIETANFAGYQKNLVLAIHPQDIVAGSVIAGEQISSKEAGDIQEALLVLRKITAHEQVLVFKNISQALSKIVKILKDKNYQNISENNTIHNQIHDVFNIFENKIPGKIDIFDVRMAIQLLINPDVSESKMQNLLLGKYNCKNEFNIGHTLTTHRSLPCLSQEYIEITTFSKTTDIYLVGDSGDDNEWRESIAIPMIKESNLTYYVAEKIDLSILLDAHTLLFVIPKNSRSLATMSLAAYCIGKNFSIVLCIQNLSENNCTVCGEELSKTAINDYNRGRMYLADLASRQQVPVYEFIKETVEMAIQKTK